MKLPMDRQHYVTDNLDLVRDIANKMTNVVRDAAVDFDDLFSVGCMGLIHAASRFEPERNLKFSTYAYGSIRGYILRHLDTFTPIRVPVHVKATAALIAKQGLRDNPVEMIATELGRSPSWVQNALIYLNRNVVSAQAKIKSKTDDNTLEQFMTTADDYTVVQVEEFVSTLKEREQHILRGLMRHQTLQEIGDSLQVRYQRISAQKKDIRRKWERYVLKEANA
ncbi:MAG: sigma-70 family RNA polymerase sigma factor [Candidatus Pristimantibacillus sp.]